MAEKWTRFDPPNVWRINADLHGFLTQIKFGVPNGTKLGQLGPEEQVVYQRNRRDFQSNDALAQPRNRLNMLINLVPLFGVPGIPHIDHSNRTVQYVRGYNIVSR